jgi:hypothetical protein
MFLAEKRTWLEPKSLRPQALKFTINRKTAWARHSQLSKHSHDVRPKSTATLSV